MNNHDNDADARRKRSRRMLLAVAAIGFGPLFIAYVIFFHFPQLIPTGTTNRGALIDPPVAFETLKQTGDVSIGGGKWTLMVSAGAFCDEVCEHALYLARQVNVGLGKDASRVQRALLVSGNALAAESRALIDRDYPRLLVTFYQPGLVEAGLGPAIGGRDIRGHIFLCDPNGNIMMYYTPAQGGKEILEDLKHLLKISNIG